MFQINRFFALAAVFSLALVGCTGGSDANQTAAKSELDAYLAEHPESANAEMAELNE